MLFLTHILFGFLTALISRDFFSGGNYSVFLFLVLLGSVLPDIDERKSKIAKGSGLIGLVVGFFFKHRGFFHSLVFLVLAVLLVKLFFGDYYGWGLFLGLAGHLLLDSMSKKGINWFYPFYGGEMKGFIKVGSGGELVLRAGLWGIILYILIF